MHLSVLGRLCAVACAGAVLTASVLLVITPLGEVYNLSVATGFRRLIVLDNPRYSEVCVTLPGLSTGVSAYLFDLRPAKDLSIRLPEISYHVNFEGKNFHYVRYDLLPGSQVSVKWILELPTNSVFPKHIQFTILRGERALSRFNSGRPIDPSTILHSESISVKFPNWRGHFDFYAPQVPWDSSPVDDDAHFFVFTTRDPKQPILGTITYNVVANMYSTIRPAPIQRCVPHYRRPRLREHATDQPSAIDAETDPAALDVQSCSFSLERDEKLPPIPYYLLIVAQKDLPTTHLLDFIVTYIPTQFAELLVYYTPWVIGIGSAAFVFTCAGWLEWLFVWVESTVVVVLGSSFLLCCGCGMCVFERCSRGDADDVAVEEGHAFIPTPVPPHEQTPLVRAGRGSFRDTPPRYTPPRAGSTPTAPQRKIPG